ncbi:hypothetical protein L596_013920 [Steinernema carpocapsae]|uniref:TIL domain-containing protein n=1 Tax=Steinernema carpocapsae TaxID=34508 RepID=A0A4U5P2E7_STECR|nr:hypothetical protein L596_013920 [Steinernema carpocapsae]
MASAMISASILLVFIFSIAVAHADNTNDTQLLGACKDHEQWESCTECEHHCEGGTVCPNVVEDCHYPVCRCIEGYSRNSSGVCIPTNSCPVANVTLPVVINETMAVNTTKNATMPTESTTVGPLTSTNSSLTRTLLPERISVVTSAPVEAIPISAPVASIPSSQTRECHKNEEMANCSTCEATCTHEDRTCVNQYCKAPRCQCKNGYVRSPYGACVLPKQCWNLLFRAPTDAKMEPLPARKPNNCRLDCAPGYICILGPRVFISPELGYEIYPICVPEKFRKFYTHLN